MMKSLISLSFPELSNDDVTKIKEKYLITRFLLL